MEELKNRHEEELRLKIVVTADLHLTTSQDNPERFHALENILLQMVEEKIGVLIITGDLFHESSQNYSEFDELCGKQDFSDIHIYVLPGNHDLHLDNSRISSENVEVISESKLMHLDEKGIGFLFLPYQSGKDMGQEIASFSMELNPEKWILFGHGDWVEGMRESNPLEPGVYMPLTRTDIDTFQPIAVFLGHIHKPMDRGKVHYPGSPCPLDITETGRRRYIVADTETGSIESRRVYSDLIYFDETIIILPVDDEDSFLRSQIGRMIDRWEVTESERSQIQLRIRVKGYTSDLRLLKKVLKEGFSQFSFYKDSEPDISEVSVSKDVERAEIARRVSESIRDIGWPETPDQPPEGQILLEALKVIYGD
jgi:DNA repair exonuclease SbcCD nuclease subunit